MSGTSALTLSSESTDCRTRPGRLLCIRRSASVRRIFQHTSSLSRTAARFRGLSQTGNTMRREKMSADASTTCCVQCFTRRDTIITRSRILPSREWRRGTIPPTGGACLTSASAPERTLRWQMPRERSMSADGIPRRSPDMCLKWRLLAKKT